MSNDTGCFKRRTFQDCFIEKDMMVVTATITIIMVVVVVVMAIVGVVVVME